MCQFRSPAYPPVQIKTVEEARIAMSYGDLMPRGRHAVPIPLRDEAYPSASFGRELYHAFENVFSDIGQPTAWSGAFTPTIGLTLTETDRCADAIVRSACSSA